MRQVLLDTHVFLWMQFETEKLSKNLKKLFASEEICWHLSQVSLWEIQIKHDLGKLNLPQAPRELLPGLIEESGLGFHPLENEAIFMLGKLPAIHRDPFDRLLIATAVVNGWEVATADARFADYPVHTLI